MLDELRETEGNAPGRPFAEHLADVAAGPKSDVSTPESETDEARAHREMLLELGREYLEAVGGSGGVAEFTTWLDVATNGSTTESAGVDLVTFHRAKGLEWSVVFVTGLERGMVPISWATSAPARAEERRLLHVALSRAEDELHCSWARARTVGSRRAEREPSPWLGLIEEVANHSPHGLLQRRLEPRDHLAELRATLAAASPASPPPERAHRLHRDASASPPRPGPDDGFVALP